MYKKRTLPKVICADRVYMTDTTMKALERMGQIIWSNCKNEEAFIQMVHETNPEVIISDHFMISDRVMDASSHLKGIISWGVGYNQIDVEAASQRGIYVANMHGANAEAVAEHVFALILCFSRKILQIENYVRTGKWSAKEEYGLPSNLLAQDIYEKTLGIIGLGAIGAHVARIAHGFNMHVLAYDAYISANIAKDKGAELCELEKLLKESDFITIHVPITSETKGMISTRELNIIKPTTYLINTSRGAVVDEEALISALKEKKIAGAGLDVFTKEPIDFENPLLTFDNVILTSHTAYFSKEANEATSKMGVEEAVRILKGQVPKNLVNRSQLVKKGYLS